MDIIQQLGPLAIASRLKRLSERLMKDGSRIYQEQNIDFQPRWFPVFYLLAQRSPLAVTQIAHQLRLTHPAVNQTAGAMSKAGLLLSSRDNRDDRKRLLSLSPKGKELATRLVPIWQDIEQAVRELVKDCSADLLKALDRIEAALDETAMFDRIMIYIKKRQYQEVEIIDYKPQYRKQFKLLNREWLEKYFRVEPIDDKILDDPYGQILKKGGQILFARLKGTIVGTATLIRHDQTTYELSKLAVTADAQGQQVGRRLGLAAIERAQSLGAKTLILGTNPKLIAANKLYQQLGFKPMVPAPKHFALYRRRTIAMKMKIVKGRKKR